MTRFSRRDFLKGSAASGLVLGSGAAPRLLFGAPQANSYDTLVVVFLRGAMDGLTLLSPGANHADRGHYEAARANTAVPLSGAGAGLPISNDQWRFHARAPELRNLFQSNRLAVVLGAGMPGPVTRSHFDAQTNMELGLAGQSSGIGWLTRALLSAGLPASVPIPAVCAGSITATSLLASTEAITMGDGADFRLNTAAWGWGSRDNYDTPPPAAFRGFAEVLPDLWQGNSALERAGRQAHDALDLIRPIDFDAYAPAGGADYDDGNPSGTPHSEFAAQLKMIAQLIKSDLGLRVATVDIGGWDTHNGQNYRFGELAEELSRALNAFHTDLAGSGHSQRANLVVMSEFGRRVQENDDGGTDHGYGNIMLALGGSVNGGQTYGTFPGLAPDQLFEGADIEVSTDYRRVLSEALIRRQSNPNVYYVFPGYADHTPINVFQGDDLPPTNFDAIFNNGFDGN